MEFPRGDDAHRCHCCCITPRISSQDFMSTTLVPSTPSHSPVSKRCGVPFTTPLLQQSTQPQQAHVQSIRTYHSGDFKSPLGSFCRKVSMPLSYGFLSPNRVKVPPAAEEYMAHSRLSLATAQTKVINANNNTIKKRFEEYHALLKIGEDGGDLTTLDPRTSLTVARLARATLASEYHLALTKRDACQQELVVLQDAVDEALVYLSSADRQVAWVFNFLNNEGINIPQPPSPFFPTKPTYENPCHLFTLTSMNEGGSGSGESLSSGDSGGGESM